MRFKDYHLPASIKEPPAIKDVLSKLPEDDASRAEMPICTGVLDYFPLALAAVAKHSKQANDKHNPGEPLHWARGKSRDHVNCILRHLIERGTIDSKGYRHSAALAWRALALLQEELEREAGFTPKGDANETQPSTEPGSQTIEALRRNFEPIE